eukprot:3709834-Lingulodinium_polyedra.AAC.1
MPGDHPRGFTGSRQATKNCSTLRPQDCIALRALARMDIQTGGNIPHRPFGKDETQGHVDAVPFGDNAMEELQE